MAEFFGKPNGLPFYRVIPKANLDLIVYRFGGIIFVRRNNE